MSGTIKGHTYPGQLYMAFGPDGKPHFYRKDPMGARDLSEIEIDLGKTLVEEFGHCDPVNPMIIRVAAVINQRGSEFNITVPGKIRAEQINAHLEDLDGHIIEILQMRSGDPRHPLNGIVMDRAGKMIGQRLYNGTGFCEDGVPFHRLVVIDGPLPGTVQDPPVPGTEEEEKGAGGDAPATDGGAGAEDYSEEL